MLPPGIQHNRGFDEGLHPQVRHRPEVPTTSVAQGAGYAWGAGQKLGTERWKGATRASTLDGRAWLAAHPDLAFSTAARQVSSLPHACHASMPGSCLRRGFSRHSHSWTFCHASDGTLR